MNSFMDMSMGPGPRKVSLGWPWAELGRTHTMGGQEAGTGPESTIPCVELQEQHGRVKMERGGRKTVLAEQQSRHSMKNPKMRRGG